MNFFQAILLAVVQGLTEFLPVSSSGHLVLFQRLFGLEKPEVLFNICLHVGTLIAIIIIFSQNIRSIILAIFRLPSLVTSNGGLKNTFLENAEIRMFGLIIAGSIPTVLLGLFFHRMKETIFSSVPLVGIMLLVTGIILWSSRWANQNGRDIKRATLGDAFIIGFAQGIAVLPGISRSGFTIVAGLFSGIGRQTAARYSFLLSIPAIIGALLLELIGTDVPPNISIWNIMIGIVTSAIVGFVTLKILLNMVNNGKLYLFAPYCWAMGVALLVSQFWIPY